jgi:hypothetical protein
MARFRFSESLLLAFARVLAPPHRVGLYPRHDFSFRHPDWPALLRLPITIVCNLGRLRHRPDKRIFDMVVFIGPEEVFVTTSCKQSMHVHISALDFFVENLLYPADYQCKRTDYAWFHRPPVREAEPVPNFWDVVQARYVKTAQTTSLFGL